MSNVQRAYKEVLAHWTRLSNGTEGENEEPDALSCDFCTLFLSHPSGNGNLDCSGCPIFEYTGKKYCYGTPYWDVYGARKEENPAEFKRLAKIELEFLKSLKEHIE